MLSNLISEIKDSLPLPRFGKWDVQVLKESLKEQKSDKEIFSLISGIKTEKPFILDSMNNIFNTDFADSNYQTIASFDSFISFNGVKESKIVSQAIERGSFRSVNKIDQPKIVNVQLAKGGFYKGIENCLDNLRALEKSTAICRVITPFGVVDNLNLIKLSYSYKKETGANLLIADLQFQEIISSEQQEPFSFANLKNPTDSDTVNTGLKVAK